MVWKGETRPSPLSSTAATEGEGNQNAAEEEGGGNRIQFPPPPPPRSPFKRGKGAVGYRLKGKSASKKKKKKTDANDDREEFYSYYRRSGVPSPELWPLGSDVFVSPSVRAGDVRYDLGGGGRDAAGAGHFGPEPNAAVAAFPLDGWAVRFSGPLLQMSDEIGRASSLICSNSYR